MPQYMTQPVLRSGRAAQRFRDIKTRGDTRANEDDAIQQHFPAGLRSNRESWLLRMYARRETGNPKQRRRNDCDRNSMPIQRQLEESAHNGGGTPGS